MRRVRDSGVVLVNVLVILAIAAGIVALMLSAEERATRAARLAAGAAQAEALALGAEQTVRSALRADMDEAPQEDHLGEAWAVILQDEIAIATGRFAVSARDARGRFDLNRLALRQPADRALFERLCAALGLPPEMADAVASEMAARGPLEDASALEASGAPPEARRVLLAHVDVHPLPATINLNSASPELMEALFSEPGAARRLLARRASAGRLGPEDLRRLGLLLPPGAGFVSDLFDVTVLAEASGARIVLRSRLLRTLAGPQPRVLVLRRRIGAEAPR